MGFGLDYLNAHLQSRTEQKTTTTQVQLIDSFLNERENSFITQNFDIDEIYQEFELESPRETLFVNVGDLETMRTREFQNILVDKAIEEPKNILDELSPFTSSQITKYRLDYRIREMESENAKTLESFRLVPMYNPTQEDRDRISKKIWTIVPIRFTNKFELAKYAIVSIKLILKRQNVPSWVNVKTTLVHFLLSTLNTICGFEIHRTEIVILTEYIDLKYLTLSEHDDIINIISRNKK